MPKKHTATVTKYPTGVFGIATLGHHFYAFAATEEEARAAIATINPPPSEVTWRECYFHQGNVNDYRSRPYTPAPPAPPSTNAKKPRKRAESKKIPR